MLAKAADELPVGDGWLYEPKWDGFRCVVFRDGDEVVLDSRNERPLTRYFPELIAPLQACLPERCVVDAELVVPGPTGLDFDALQQRIHPAASRVNRLAAETPAHVLAFDLLAVGDRDLRELPLRERRELLAANVVTQSPVHLSPATTDPERRPHLVRAVRGRGPRRHRGQAPRRALPPGRAHDGEGEAPPHLRLRRGRLPVAQGRRGHRLAAARPLRRRRRR